MTVKSVIICLCLLKHLSIIMVDASLFSNQPNFFLSHSFQKNSCHLLKREVSRNLQNAACKPRETMVDVVSDVANILIFPNKIPVNRCNGGFCNGQASCLPLKTKMVKYAVRKHDTVTMRDTCGVIQIEEHTKCKCKCSVMDNHCNEKQKYHEKECSCKCFNLDEKAECLEEGRLWDSKTCTCECTEEQRECSTGAEWVPSICRCLKTGSKLVDERK